MKGESSLHLARRLLPLALALALWPQPAFAATVTAPVRPAPAATKPATPHLPMKPAPAPAAPGTPPNQEPTAPGRVHFHHHGPVGFAFVRLAARSLGIGEESFMNEIYQKGLPATLRAHGQTKGTLVDKMTADVAAHAKAHGKPIDIEKVKGALSQMYDHLTGAA